MMYINQIPQEAHDEIRFLMGDSTSCTEVLKDILEDWFGEPWEDGNFFILEPEEIPALYIKIYESLYLRKEGQS